MREIAVIWSLQYMFNGVFVVVRHTHLRLASRWSDVDSASAAAAAAAAHYAQRANYRTLALPAEHADAKSPWSSELTAC